MSMDINIHITADSELIRALSDIAGCMAAISIAKADHTDMVPPEKAAKTPEPAKKAESKKNTKAKEKPLTGEPVSPAKAKEINDLVKEPEPKKAEAADKPTTEEIEAIRGKAGEFMKADKTTNQPMVLCQDLVQHKMRNFNYFQLTNRDSLATLAL
ncbi:conjugal transfer protein TraF [Selenomonas sp. WCA-380-WT-3B 3/]|uniref:Conjugal transfer protein TraF n=1 Tax=Selenomonas montiformis TaxID=2652285 RepID=A0A6I2UXR3_9FIRM|nr:hypothetical protein [Selenomonas montiformis]MSV25977.1 conjugal transfer protein TraF [Selenomonas montiformis]